MGVERFERGLECFTGIEKGNGIGLVRHRLRHEMLVYGLHLDWTSYFSAMQCLVVRLMMNKVLCSKVVCKMQSL